LVEEVQNYATAQKFDLVLAGDNVMFALPTLDITPQVLAALQARGGAPVSGAAPKSGSTANGK